MENEYQEPYRFCNLLSQDLQVKHQHLKEITAKYETLYQNYTTFLHYLKQLSTAYPRISEEERLTLKAEELSLVDRIKQYESILFPPISEKKQPPLVDRRSQLISNSLSDSTSVLGGSTTSTSSTARRTTIVHPRRGVLNKPYSSTNIF